MNRELVDRVVNAVLYEGYILYPYRASSKKNQRERFTFGRVYPNDYSKAQNGIEPWVMQTECLVRNESRDGILEVSVRFLQPSAREVRQRPPLNLFPEGEADAHRQVRDVLEWPLLSEIIVGDELYQTWQEALEREVNLSQISLNESVKQAREFEFAAAYTIEPIGDGRTAVMVRRNETIRGQIELETRFVDQTVTKITVRISNHTGVPPAKMNQPSEIIMRTFSSTHTILQTQGGEFISSLDPDPAYVDAAKTCQNIGTWPVLVGDETKHERDTMLSSPIILYDYPKIAAESPGDLFDGTEIDEILTLRVQTMTDQEKREMRQVDEHARKILERVENLSPDQLHRMHGTMRNVRSLSEDFFNPAKRIDTAKVGGVNVKLGDRVRIRPRKRADVMDMALDGKIAIIEAIEQDVEDQIHFALILEDDPGKDLGLMRQPGHRFFYGADEVEPVAES